VNFFTPCLLFSKVVFSLSAGMGMLTLILPTRHLPLFIFIDEFWELWIIPLFFVLISGTSLVVAWLLAFVFRLNRPQRYVSVPFLPTSSLNISSRNFGMAAAMIMNSNSLPVALLQSLAVSVPGLEWGQNDTINSIVGRAITYILLGGTTGQFVSFFLSLIVLKTSQFLDSLELRSSLTL
jgi:predicted permease